MKIGTMQIRVIPHEEWVSCKATGCSAPARYRTQQPESESALCLRHLRKAILDLDQPAPAQRERTEPFKYTHQCPVKDCARVLICDEIDYAMRHWVTCPEHGMKLAARTVQENGLVRLVIANS
jgi:hypothetical protein